MQAVSPEVARLERKFDWAIVFIAFTVMVGAFHVHQMLVVGDWDFWTDWKDRRWWVTLTPILLITFPAAVQYALWEKFRLPFGATFVVLALHFGQWVNRYVNFWGWAWYPINFVWPTNMIPSALALDLTLMLTGSYMVTALFGGFAWALLMYPANWPMLAPFHVPVDWNGNVTTLADLSGYQYVRSSTPEYIRIIERGTLRTFGKDVAPVSAFFAGFISGLVYLWWHFMGRWFCTTRFLKQV